MKKALTTVIVLLICVSLVCSVSAAEFVNSISYKDHPDIVETEDGYVGVLNDPDGNPIGNLEEGCIKITSVSDPDAPQSLLDVYEALKDGTMKIPYGDDNDWVVRDLFNITILCKEHAEMLKNGNKLDITLNLGVSAGTKVNVMLYVDGAWRSVAATNNGDGTVTLSLDAVGEIAISVPASTNVTNPNTGDTTGNGVLVWGVVMAIAALALVILLVKRRNVVR